MKPGALIVIVGGFAGAACSTIASAPAPIPMRPLTQSEKVALASALSQTLNDPGAAQFKWLPVAITDQPTVGYCGLVNGKNLYGGYVGFRRFYAVISKLPDGSFGAGKIENIEGRPITFGGDSTVDDAVQTGLTEGRCRGAGYTDFSGAQ